jgi:hypothetical protein
MGPIGQGVLYSVIAVRQVQDRRIALIQAIFLENRYQDPLSNDGITTSTSRS